MYWHCKGHIAGGGGQVLCKDKAISRAALRITAKKILIRRAAVRITVSYSVNYGRTDYGKNFS